MTSYRLGCAIVVGTVVVAFALCLARVDLRAERPRAAQTLDSRAFPLGAFRLKERSGRTIAAADLADRVWIASFIFTRCPLSCPRITSVMRGLQAKLAGTNVQLVSISVDPEHDTPPVLADYAGKFGADPVRWWFLTGPESEVIDLVTQRFKLGVAEQPGPEAISHSSRLALVDRGNRVVGFFDSDDPEAVVTLLNQARQRGGPVWTRRLPALNAALNSLCAVLLLVGWTLIRRGRTRGHATCMIAAVIVASLFLTSYLVYHYHAGSVPFEGTGPTRLAYFTVLLSHTVLATFGVVPLVALTLTRALRRDFARHARLARVTFPIWLYVSITGVVIYGMLYQLPAATP